MRLPSRHPAQELPQVFKALSDLTRLRLLNLMSEGEVCVCHFGQVIGINQPKVSRHLSYLKRAGLVSARREGPWVHYRWAVHENLVARRLLDGLRDWMSGDEGFARERQRLAVSRCR